MNCPRRLRGGRDGGVSRRDPGADGGGRQRVRNHDLNRTAPELALVWPEEFPNPLDEAEAAGNQPVRDPRDVSQGAPPAHMPPYSAFVVDDAGALWIQDLPGPRDDEVAWRRFLPVGSYDGLAILPAGLEVFEIGEGHASGVWRDGLNVEYVQLFGLQSL